MVVPAAQYEEYLRLRDAEDERRVREAVADDRPGRTFASVAELRAAAGLSPSTGAAWVPYRIHFREEAWTLFLALPTTMREQVVELLAVLVDTPAPPGVKTYEHVPDTFRADLDEVTVFYRITGTEIDVAYLRPNS